ncbi:LPS-assembly protein LptD [Jannaschia sp. M317]|uniref:LPS-assembly protein LptD n=1 Tax=Jannaschia sp. M317 TaxID=2867011 RepID=UPI0021A71229|nr:LPS assembly protein LptD [Jannaschia sp. M317]UWQ17155.1 LPS assembly protein LptD [Jannaschia sp. M317]
MRALILAGLLALTTPAAAQDALPVTPATLVADRIDFDQGQLSATGEVEIFADGRILRATRITYLRDEDRLLVEGPLTLIDGPDQILVAEFASLSADLRGSVLQGARLVLDQRLQIAATEVAQGPAGRYTQLYQTVASSCPVCDGGKTPLWQIRAKRIIHDKQERQLYFDQARFDVAGVPVAWFPRLRLPDPTLDRTSGWLAPRFSSDDTLGTGVTTPYFVTLGPSADLTFSPFLTNTDTRSLGVRYRQAFERGDLLIEGALSEDRVTADPWRGYLFAEGTFALKRGYRLEFDLETVSDDTYLVDYDVSDKDRLDSRLAVTKVERDSRAVAEVILFESLRTGEDNRFLPTRVLNAERQRRFVPAGLGGQAIWTLAAHARERTATHVPAGQPSNAARDVVRASAALDWRRSWITDGGLVVTGLGGVHVDAYNVRQDTAFSDTAFARAVPYGGVEFRLPMTRTTAGNVRHVLEPVAQLILAPSNRPVTPDEDSLTPEFDEGNLFSATRFAGRDTRELGTRANLGVSYTRYDPSGWTAGVLVGRVVRARDLGQFRPGTGLDGGSSDWLLSVGASHAGGFEVMQRSIFDDQFTFARSETILRWQGSGHLIDTRYTYLEADPTAGRPIDTSEWSFDASLDLAGDWTGRANWRYDFVTNDASNAGLGLTYRSDCVTVDFDVERRFTSTASLQPSTRFGLSVELAGFGADDRRTRARKCGL